MTQPDATPTMDALESLFVNNHDLDRISIYLNRFNPIRVMGMQGMEIRHSAILAWLLDPSETHGLGDRFLKAFLAEALRERNGAPQPSALEVSQSDLSDTEIRREWQNIDIFVLSPRNGWAFIVENKFYSRQREGQLAKYMGKVRATFDRGGHSLKIRGIFLTLLDENPQDESYAPIRYATICELLPRLISRTNKTVGPEIRVFLDHYIDIIRDAAGMSHERDEMERLARELYRRHKKALDFIIERGARTDFVLAADSVFRESAKSGEIVTIDGHRFMYSGQKQHQQSFLPGEWYDALGEGKLVWEGCQGWWAGFPLICWFQLFGGGEGGKGSLMIYAEVGPIADHGFRTALIEAIQKQAQDKHLKSVGFQRTATDEGKRYSRFLKGNSKAILNTQNAEEIAEAMRKQLEEFRPVFSAVAEILPGFRKHVTQPGEAAMTAPLAQLSGGGHV